jgi:glycosyltransferase involved in cell wall biosynthesis
MRIAFDFNPILINRFSGFYAYGTGLLQGFEALDEKPEFLLFHSRRFSEQAKLVKKGLGHWAQLRATSIKMRWLENFWRYCNYPSLQRFTGEFDIYHCLHHLMPTTKNRPRILTVYDLRRYKIPKFYPKSKLDLFELALKRADHIIAISEATKNDLCSLFNISDEKVDVVELAADAAYKPLPEFEKQEAKKRLAKQNGTQLDDYLMVFSSPDRRKNISRIIKAFISAQSRLPDNFKLVIAGKLPRNEDIFQLIASSKKAGSIVAAGPVDNVRNLLSCAEGLVFASLYEGFGIPILEAFACGVPVITSDCSSMPEVAGDAAILVDPYDESSITEAMVSLTADKELKERLIGMGLARAKDFSWQQTARKTLEIYKKVL